MKKSAIFGTSFVNACATVAYVALVVWFMTRAEEFLGRGHRYLGPLTFLMLFVVSAATVGLLIFGRPVYWFMNGKRREAVELAVTTVGICLVVTICLILVLLATASS